MLLKKQEFLESKIDQELSTAKANGTKNKRVAIAALKRKKRYERQLQQIDGTLSTIEMQREALEGANTNTHVLTAMGDAAKAMKAAHQHLDIDKVHDMMDDIAEQQDVAREISDVISNPTAFGNDLDEDELERELEELEQEDLDSALLDVGPIGSKTKDLTLEDELPNVPSTSVAGKKQATPVRAPKQRHVVEEDDDDMKELAAWAS